jgi:FkbH-like protein
MHHLEHLSWLPRPPSDFSAKLRNAASMHALRALAAHALDENQLQKLCNQLVRLRSEGAEIKGLTHLRIGLLSNSTTQTIAPVLIGTALRYGILLDIVQAEFNQVAQAAFSTHTPFDDVSLHAVIISIDHHGLPLTACPGDSDGAEQMLNKCYDHIASIVSSVQKKTGAQVILHNIAPPVEDLFGSFEGRLPGTATWLISRLNERLDSLSSTSCFILDIEGLSSKVGTSNWHDPTLWNLGKLPFAPRFLAIYAEYACRILAATQGKSRRCLILDLDNTLWGGVIGDDGLEGILIGNGDPTGEAHLYLQQTISELRNRGVVLAVSSKNDEANARLPFQQHPDMLLKESDIAVFQANWKDKAANIKAISQALSLGLESMVFLDDNPAERMQVRQELPEVAVPELPEDPAHYAATLASAGYFEALAFSEEDRNRAAFYQGNSKRGLALEKITDMGAYLLSLKMEISLSPFDKVGRSRIVQLISKSNQFNLTTRRYSDLQVASLESDSNVFTSQVRLKDTFGDNGMISVVICRKYMDYWEIDTWLMSCRVLGRRVEEAVLQDIVTHAKQAGVRKLIGIYISTDRNALVKHHYEKLGFTQIEQTPSEERWELVIDDYQFKDLPMQFLK